MATETLSSESDDVPSFLSRMVVPIVLNVASVLAGLMAIVAGFLYVKQDSLLYFPEIGGVPRRPSQNPRGYRNPDEHNVAYENCRIPCADGVNIHAWLLYAINPNAVPSYEKVKPQPTIVFFHGNAGNIGLRLPNAIHLQRATNANILLVEYRGYGDSDTVPPNEIGIELDAQAAIHFCVQHPHIDSTKLFLFGRSLGGAVALYLAEYAQHNNIPIAGVMVENTFTSISDMVDHLMPWVAPFKSLVLRISWDSTQRVKHLKMPLLFLAGSADELVPSSHTSRLIELAQSSSPSVSLHVIPGGTHNECWVQGGDPYWKAITKFVHDNSNQQSAPAISPESENPTASSKSNADASTIPTMSKKLMDMLFRREAAGSSTTTQQQQSKKEL